MTSRDEDGCRLLKIGEVVNITGISKSVIYAMVRRGEFPPPIKIGYKTARWSSEEVYAWMRDIVRVRGLPKSVASRERVVGA
ncbi:MAG: AlpA family phage regulatory protein [Geminicoccaceae bacterium]|nr:AlpA family phage regulatory protein [Geminicoccaceae bacterium]